MDSRYLRIVEPFVRKGAKPGKSKFIGFVLNSGACPLVSAGDLIVTRREQYSQGKFSIVRKTITVSDLVYNKNIQGRCGSIKELELIKGSDNNYYHPGNDVVGIDCNECSLRRQPNDRRTETTAKSTKGI